MPASGSKKQSKLPKTKEAAHHKERVEASHTTKTMTRVKFAAPKRFSHSAIGNR